MAEPVLDELWKQVAPLLPLEPEFSPWGGRLQVNNRQAFTGVVFVFRTGIPRQFLPIEISCGSASTCWR